MVTRLFRLSISSRLSSGSWYVSRNWPISSRLSKLTHKVVRILSMATDSKVISHFIPNIGDLSCIFSPHFCQSCLIINQKFKRTEFNRKPQTDLIFSSMFHDFLIDYFIHDLETLDSFFLCDTHISLFQRHRAKARNSAVTQMRLLA